MKILIIEDNIKLASSLKKGLEAEGYSVELSHDGISGQKQLALYKDIYDLVILDLMLPEKDGITVCKEWREENINTPVIMLTARDSTEDKVLGLDSGADDYLVKPFEFSELLARMRALMRRPSALQSEILTAGPLSLNTSEHQLRINGKPVLLTVREYALIEYFMRHPNQVLSRDQILQAVWDFAFDSFSNVVDVHIKNLRKKLSTYGDNLKTIRGMGYRLET